MTRSSCLHPLLLPSHPLTALLTTSKPSTLFYFSFNIIGVAIVPLLLPVSPVPAAPAHRPLPAALLPRSSGTWKGFPAAIKVVADSIKLQPMSNGPGHEGGPAAVLGAESEAALGLSLRHPNIVATYAALTIEQLAAPDGQTCWTTYLVMGECIAGS